MRCQRGRHLCHAERIISGPTNNYSFSFTDWLYNGPNHPGQIQVDGQDLCMQLDHAAGNTVIMATCNGASYQKWAAFYAPGG